MQDENVVQPKELQSDQIMMNPGCMYKIKNEYIWEENGIWGGSGGMFIFESKSYK